MNNEERSALNYAFRVGDTKKAIDTLKRRHVNPNMWVDNLPLLHLAIEKKQVSVARFLIEHPMTNLNQRAPKKRLYATALSFAVSFLPEIVPDLLKKFADPNEKSEKGITPFLKAAMMYQEGKNTCLKDFLADRRTNILTKDDRGRTVYELASVEGKAELEKHPYIAKYMLFRSAKEQTLTCKEKTQPSHQSESERPAKKTMLKP